MTVSILLEGRELVCTKLTGAFSLLQSSDSRRQSGSATYLFTQPAVSAQNQSRNEPKNGERFII